MRKPCELNAIVTEKFVKIGESARNAYRPEVMRVIRYAKTCEAA